MTLTRRADVIYSDTAMSRRAPNPEELHGLVGKLRDYRLRRSLTEKALAKKLGIAFVTLNRWLNRHTLPSELHAYRIKMLLGGVPEKGHREKKISRPDSR